MSPRNKPDGAAGKAAALARGRANRAPSGPAETEPPSDPPQTEPLPGLLPDPPPIPTWEELGAGINGPAAPAQNQDAAAPSAPSPAASTKKTAKAAKKAEAKEAPVRRRGRAEAGHGRRGHLRKLTVEMTPAEHDDLKTWLVTAFGGSAKANPVIKALLTEAYTDPGLTERVRRRLDPPN